MRIPLVSALVLALALAGCSGDGDDDGTTPTPTPGPAPGSPPATPPGPTSPPVIPPAGGGNEPPVADLAAVTDGLTVNVTIGGSDPDGDALTWTLDFGDGSTADGPVVPGVANHTYAAAGLYNLTVVVSDGEDEDAMTIPLNLSVAGEAVTFSGHTTVLDPYAGPVGTCPTSLAPPLEEVAWYDFPVTPDVWGWTWSFAAPGHTTNWWVGTSDIPATGASGTVPEGVDHVTVCADSADGVDADFLLTVAPPA